MSDPKKPKVVFIVGPTATGKTGLAVTAARKFGGEVINADSVQVYKSVNIGTAKPSAEEMAGVPHHLLSFVEEGQTFTAGDFRKAARSLIESRAADGQKLFFLVGGSGFYVQALEKGMYDQPKTDPAIRESVGEEARIKGVYALYAELEQRDPSYAASISANDRYRVQRGIEILRAGLHPSQLKAQFQGQGASEEDDLFEKIKIGLSMPRERLRAQVEARTRSMIDRGLVAEVKGLMDHGLADWAPLGSVGYREAQSFLRGEITENEMFEQIVTSTMQLAKRQMTWFRRDEELTWFETSATEGPNRWDKALEFLSGKLSVDTSNSRPQY